MSKISVIIPFYPSSPEKYEVLQKCVKSLPEHYETIVVWHNEGGMAWAINQGVRCATGTHLLIMNDDVEWLSGDLNDLCFGGTSTSPSFRGRTYDLLWGSCFCVPKAVWEKIGDMDERYDGGYFVDDDIIKTLQFNNFPMQAVPSVVFDHKHPGTTLDKDPNRTKSYDENKVKFNEKWNIK